MEPGASPEGAQKQTTNRGRIAFLVVVVLGHAIKHVYNAGFFFLLPDLKDALALSNTRIGTLSTVRNMAGGMANLPAGFLADRFRHRWALMLGLSLALVGLFHYLVGSMQSFWLLVLASSGVGIAITFYHPPAIAALSERFSDRRGLAVSLHGTGGSLGEAIGPLLVGGLLLSFLSWDQVFRASMVPALVAGTVLWLLVRRTQGIPSGTASLGTYFASLRHLVRNRGMVVVLVATGGFSMAQSAIVTFLPIYLRSEYSPQITAVYLSVSQVVGIASQPAMGVLSDRLGRKVVLLPGVVGLAVTILGLALVPPGLPLLVTVAAMGAFSFPLMAILLATALDAAGEGVQATTVSLVFGAAIVFSGVSPYLAGAVADAFGVKAVFLYASAFAGATALLLALDRGPRPVMHRP